MQSYTKNGVTTIKNDKNGKTYLKADENEHKDKNSLSILNFKPIICL